MSSLSDSEKVKKLSREIIDYLLKHPETTKEKITNIKGRIGKNFKYNKVFIFFNSGFFTII